MEDEHAILWFLHDNVTFGRYLRSASDVGWIYAQQDSTRLQLLFVQKLLMYMRYKNLFSGA
jgi:hypothetical protein